MNSYIHFISFIFIFVSLFYLVYKLILAIIATTQTAQKLHSDIVSGSSSATYGVKMVAVRQKVLQMPKVVAIIETGKSLLFAMKTVLKELEIPILAANIITISHICYVV